MTWLLLPGLVVATYGGSALARPAAFLLIADSRVDGLPRLGGCDRELALLQARLLPTGASQLLVDPSGDVLRRDLLQFAKRSIGLPHVFVVCGYAATNGNELFMLPNDAAPNDLGRGAISVAVFPRLLGGSDGATVLDLHPVADPKAAVAAAAAWGGQVGSGSANHMDRRIVSIENDPGQAALIQHLEQSDTSSIDDLLPGQAVQPHTTAMLTSPSQTPSAPSRVAAATAAAPPPSSISTPIPPEVASPRPSTPIAAVMPAVSARSAVRGPTPAKRRRTHATRNVEGPLEHLDDTTRRIQVALLARGLFMGTVSGMDGHSTQASVRHFQLLLGQPPTGHLTADELKQLTGG